MTNPRKPPIDISEEPQEEEPGRGRLTYAERAPRRGGGGTSNFNMAQILVAALLGMVLSLLAVTQLMPTKGNLNTLTSEVARQVGALDARLLKDTARLEILVGAMGTYVKKDDLTPYASKNDLSPLATKEAINGLSVSLADTKKSLDELTKKIGATDGLGPQITSLNLKLDDMSRRVTEATATVNSVKGGFDSWVEYNKKLNDRLLALETTKTTQPTPIPPTGTGQVTAEVSTGYGNYWLPFEVTSDSETQVPVKVKVTNGSNRAIENVVLFLTMFYQSSAVTSTVPATNQTLNLDYAGGPALRGSPNWARISGGNSSPLTFVTGGMFGSQLSLDPNQTKTLQLMLALRAVAPTSGGNRWNITFSSSSITVDSFDYK